MLACGMQGHPDFCGQAPGTTCAGCLPESASASGAFAMAQEKPFSPSSMCLSCLSPACWEPFEGEARPPLLMVNCGGESRANRLVHVTVLCPATWPWSPTTPQLISSTTPPSFRSRMNQTNYARPKSPMIIRVGSAKAKKDVKQNPCCPADAACRESPEIGAYAF